MNVLVTGGAGYIGSHAARRLLRDGHAVTVVDDLSCGNRGAVEILKSAGGDFEFTHGSMGDVQSMTTLMKRRKIELVMHFGGKTYVGESVLEPLKYYRGNTAETLGLLEAMQSAGVEKIVFSSTCATYGEPPPQSIPINESLAQNPISPYGRSKLQIEHMLFDYLRSLKEKKNEGAFGFAALRYFNVAGSDEEGKLGEDHRPETHLIPICLEAALGQRKAVTIFGTDYPTSDGTCVRDYVHVEDLVDAHVTVMKALKGGEARTYNIGIGKGYSVREVIEACRRATGVKFAETAGARREGDPPALFADAKKIERELGWKAKRTNLEEIIASAWRWKKEHPKGYTK